MKNTSITGIDFLTNKTCHLFGINTHDKNKEHREVWIMFNSIQNKNSLEGFTDQDLCNRINVSFEEHMRSKLVISVLSEKILSILENHIKKKSIHYDDAHQMIWEMLYEHQKISVGDFM